MSKNKNNVNIFAERLGQLIKENNYIHEDVASAVGVTRQGVGKWVSGDSVPDVLTTAKVAKFFGVSVDYLAGASDVRSADTELKAVCDYTGLSESNIKLFAELNKAKHLQEERKLYEKLLNVLKEEDYMNFPYDIDIISTMIDVLDSYVEMMGNIKHAAVVNINHDIKENVDDELWEIAQERKKTGEESIYRKIYNNGTILSGYHYKRYLFQSIIDESRHYFQEVIQRLTPPEYLYHDENGEIVDVRLDTQHEEAMMGLYENACMRSRVFSDYLISYINEYICKRMKEGEELEDYELEWLDHLNDDNHSAADLVKEWKENFNGFNTTKKE